MQLDLFPAARLTDPATSQANKDAFKKKISQRDVILLTYSREYEKQAVWNVLDGGITDEECGMKTRWNGATMYDQRVCYWKRCSELRKQGFIEPLDYTRGSSAGQQQQVCVITEAGRDYVFRVFGSYE